MQLSPQSDARRSGRSLSERPGAEPRRAEPLNTELWSPESQPIRSIEVLWITAGLGCDGDTIAMTGATQPSIEEILNGGLPWIPAVELHNPFLSPKVGDDFLHRFHVAAEGKLGPFILVVEGSIPDETNKPEGYWASLGVDAATGEPITTCEWIDRMAPHAWAVIAAGTCATYGGIHAMEGNPTGCTGLPDYLGWQWRSKTGIPIVCIPGCPVQPDNFTETLLYLLHMAAGKAPMIPLDEALRPRWLFGNTVHEGCDRGGYYEQAQFADQYGSPLCIVKLGCWGPVVQCNVGKRGWMAGVGGCPNVGGICIGCTMPGFPDKFMPFMDQPPGSLLSSAAVQTYGRAIHALRKFTQASLNRPPSWRQKRGSVEAGGEASRKESAASVANRPSSAPELRGSALPRTKA
jgi:hydrogenase small subunit